MNGLFSISTFCRCNYSSLKLSASFFIMCVCLTSKVVYTDLRYTLDPMHHVKDTCVGFQILKHSRYLALINGHYSESQ